jgi:hypothetical protein
VLADEARHLAEAELYVLSPQMCDVVIAAAQTLTIDDLALITSEDLPSPTGLVMLPQPLLVRAVNGNLGDDRAYHWHTPTVMPVPDLASNGWTPKPAVRFSLYHDSHGPIRPDSFTDFAHQAHAAGTPLPPLLLDAIRCLPFEAVITDEDRANLAQFADTAQRVGDQTRNRTRELGFNEDRVVGEYTPGSEIPDPDDSFTLRFLYAFWRLCEQRIATTSNAEVRHAAQLAADRAGVSPVVRVVQLRATTPDTTPGDHNSDRWHHRWVVRMHKVRQWYPSEQRHKVIYRGPYIKGPDDKPLLGGETVRGLTR